MMDQRLADRRRRVAEDRARSNLGRLIRVLVLGAMVAALVWFAQSPFLSVGEIAVDGADTVDVIGVLARHQVVEGRPMLLVDVEAAEESLRADPWVASAEVARDWPTRIEVVIEERQSFAGVRLAGGWWMAAADATLLQPLAGRPDGRPVAEFPGLDPAAADGLEVTGAVEYLAALPAPLQGGASVRASEEGLEGRVGGFVVRLGRPFEMAQKAAVTAAILERGIEAGSIITVVAPASPAVLPPGAGEPGSTAATTVPDE